MVVEKSMTKNILSEYGRKENWTNKGTNKQGAGSQSHDTTSRHQSAYQI